MAIKFVKKIIISSRDWLTYMFSLARTANDYPWGLQSPGSGQGSDDIHAVQGLPHALCCLRRILRLVSRAQRPGRHLGAYRQQQVLIVRCLLVSVGARLGALQYFGNVW